MQDGLRLYVWRDVFRDYTEGVAFALAHDEEEARGLVFDSIEWSSAEAYRAWRDDPDHDEYTHPFYELAPAPEVHDAPFGFHVTGGG